MAKFANSTTTARPKPVLPTVVTDTVVRNADTGYGYAADAKTELFTAAVTSLVEPKFYESDGGRERISALVHAVTKADPDWVRRLVPYLRNELGLRSIAALIACEYAVAGGPEPRSVINSACARADEPAEILGYWLSTQGRKIPSSVKRGVADAARRLYNGYTALKYDGGNVRMGDVLNLAHPTPRDDDQAALFGWLLDRRHGNKTSEVVPASVEAHQRLMDVPEADRRAFVDSNPTALRDARWTWERLAAWLPGGMDAKAWEAAIPEMPYFASLRNLRNFEQAGVSKATLRSVADFIADPGRVQASKIMPYQFYLAYRESGTSFFTQALEEALEASTANVPALSGKTLVLVDASGSMTGMGMSRNGAATPLTVAAVLASSLARNGDVDLGIYATSSGLMSQKTSVLRTIEHFESLVGCHGHGTETWAAVRNLYDPSKHDRIVILSDMQDNRGMSTSAPKGVPIYMWDLAGSRVKSITTTTPGHYLLAGFSDKCFTWLDQVERCRGGADWPF